MHRLKRKKDTDVIDEVHTAIDTTIDIGNNRTVELERISSRLSDIESRIVRILSLQKSNDNKTSVKYVKGYTDIIHLMVGLMETDMYGIAKIEKFISDVVYNGVDVMDMKNFCNGMMMALEKMSDSSYIYEKMISMIHRSIESAFKTKHKDIFSRLKNMVWLVGEMDKNISVIDRLGLFGMVCRTASDIQISSSKPLGTIYKHDKARHRIKGPIMSGLAVQIRYMLGMHWNGDRLKLSEIDIDKDRKIRIGRKKNITTSEITMILDMYGRENLTVDEMTVQHGFNNMLKILYDAMNNDAFKHSHSFEADDLYGPERRASLVLLSSLSEDMDSNMIITKWLIPLIHYNQHDDWLWEEITKRPYSPALTKLIVLSMPMKHDGDIVAYNEIKWRMYVACLSHGDELLDIDRLLSVIPFLPIKSLYDDDEEMDVFYIMSKLLQQKIDSDGISQRTVSLLIDVLTTGNIKYGNTFIEEFVGNMVKHINNDIIDAIISTMLQMTVIEEKEGKLIEPKNNDINYIKYKIASLLREGYDTSISAETLLDGV